MTWVSILLWLLSNLPNLLDLFKKLIDLIRSIPHKDQAVVKQGLVDAIQSGDHAKVRMALETGIAQASQPVA